MKRDIYNDLIKWKNSESRKPLILEGARQVGKTWVLKEFGNYEYKKFAYINCDKNDLVSRAFRDFDIKRIVSDLSAISGVSITPNDTLVVLDEVQEIPTILTSLKYFNEEGNDYHIIVAGSLLGIELHEGTGFPVGKVNSMMMYPLSFKEFFEAICDNKELIKRLNSSDYSSIDSMNTKYIDYLKLYYYVGGMPEVVDKYIKTKDFNIVRRLQKEIIRNYKRDFSKHALEENVPKINAIFDSVPSQLAKENKKFIYGAIKKGARAKEYEYAINWLCDAGLVYKVNRVKELRKPLNFYEDKDAFKLYFLDLGLLGAMVNTKARDVIVDDDVFVEYKGSLTEQYVLQQFLSSTNTLPYYYSKDNSTLELDFVVENDTINPIEVKAGENLKSKSLKTVLDSNQSFIGWRFSMKGFISQNNLINIPLYLAFNWFKSDINEY